MHHQRAMLCFLAYVTLAIAAIMTVKADEPAHTKDRVPEGSPEFISDWALAGVLWSDASLTMKLATEGAKRAESPQQKRQLLEISERSEKIVDALEAFGWKRLSRPSPSSASQPTDEVLPDPQAVGAALAESIDRPRTGSVAEQRASGDVPDDAAAPRTTPTLAPNIEQLDTVNPVETRIRADAIEEGVENAITAAAGRRGAERPASGRISEREVETRSATLPYADDSIYDRDDYDPDVDYNVGIPRGDGSQARVNVDRSDATDDDTGRGDPAQAIEDEVERRVPVARESTASPGRTGRQVEIDRYTDRRSDHAQDANWVQFHLTANQAVWSEFTTKANLYRRTNDALMKLRADATAAIQATDHPQLRKILQAILDESPESSLSDTVQPAE